MKQYKEENKMSLEITTENFEFEVLKSKIPVLVDFWATWCGPCKMIAPIIDQLSEDFDGKAKVGKINVDEQNALAAQFNVMTIPTLIIFKNGEIVEKFVGSRSKSDLENAINSNL